MVGLEGLVGLMVGHGHSLQSSYRNKNRNVACKLLKEKTHQNENNRIDDDKSPEMRIVYSGKRQIAPCVDPRWPMSTKWFLQNLFERIAIPESCTAAIHHSFSHFVISNVVNLFYVIKSSCLVFTVRRTHRIYVYSNSCSCVMCIDRCSVVVKICIF